MLRATVGTAAERRAWARGQAPWGAQEALACPAAKGGPSSGAKVAPSTPQASPSLARPVDNIGLLPPSSPYCHAGSLRGAAGEPKAHLAPPAGSLVAR